MLFQALGRDRTRRSSGGGCRTTRGLGAAHGAAHPDPATSTNESPTVRARPRTCLSIRTAPPARWFDGAEEGSCLSKAKWQRLRRRIACPDCELCGDGRSGTSRRACSRSPAMASTEQAPARAFARGRRPRLVRRALPLPARCRRALRGARTSRSAKRSHMVSWPRRTRLREADDDFTGSGSGSARAPRHVCLAAPDAARVHARVRAAHTRPRRRAARRRTPGLRPSGLPAECGRPAAPRGPPPAGSAQLRRQGDPVHAAEQHRSPSRSSVT